MLNRPMRVLTANIYHYDADYEKRGPVLREAVRALDADIMAFQEAGWKTNGPHQVAELLDGLGYHIDHQYDGDDAPLRNNANCIASRWPITRRELLLLPVLEPTNYPLAALAVTVHAPPPIGDFLFICNKPSWRLHVEVERENQAVAVLDMARRLTRAGDFPTLIAGDFDAAPDRASIRFFSGRQSLQGTSTNFIDAWEAAGDGSPGHTWTCENPLVVPIAQSMALQPWHRRRIDYIFVATPPLSQRVASVRNCRVVLNTPVNGVWPSDHYGVYAEVMPV